MRLLSLGRTLARGLGARDYDRRHRRSANSAYDAVTAAEPGRAIDRATERRIAHYSRAVLGSPRFAPWLRFYTAVHGNFVKGWIPDNYFGRVVLPQLQNKSQRRLTGAKTLFRRNLGTDLVPDIAAHVRGCWLDRDGRPLAAGRVAETLFRDHRQVFLKPDRSARSQGIRRLTQDDFDLDGMSACGDFVIQAPVAQAEALAAIMPDNVATIRITTVKPVASPAAARAAFVRFGRRNHGVVEAESEIDVAIVDRDGHLGELGFLPDWSLTRAHPDTGAVFAGRQVPSFAEAEAICCRLHDTVPHLAIIGWDVAIEVGGGVRLLEWNLGHMEINVTEALLGPRFTDLGWEDLRGGSARRS